jgi:murein DD-endopeptidase MepM/ murein hydrolase activator NlpD
MARAGSRSICAIMVALGGVAAALAMGSAPATAASTVPGTVLVGKTGLTVRADASANAAKVGLLPNRAKVAIACQVTGLPLKGLVRKTDKWDRLANGQYVSDAYVKRPAKVAIPACPPPPPVAPAVAAASQYVAPPITLPLTAGDWALPGVKPLVFGGFRTAARPEHDGVDLPYARNTPIKSIADGTVVTVRCNTSGPSCDVDGSTTTTGCGWYVEVRHVDNVVSRYCHMVRLPSVVVGDPVTIGQVLGYVGTSGHSSGPHLHFETHLGYPATRANAVDPVQFMAKAGAPLT